MKNKLLFTLLQMGHKTRLQRERPLSNPTSYCYIIAVPQKVMLQGYLWHQTLNCTATDQTTDYSSKNTLHVPQYSLKISHIYLYQYYFKPILPILLLLSKNTWGDRGII